MLLGFLKVVLNSRTRVASFHSSTARPTVPCSPWRCPKRAAASGRASLTSRLEGGSVAFFLHVHITDYRGNFVEGWKSIQLERSSTTRYGAPAPLAVFGPILAWRRRWRLQWRPSLPRSRQWKRSRQAYYQSQHSGLPCGSNQHLTVALCWGPPSSYH